jgi:hypothetical protein
LPPHLPQLAELTVRRSELLSAGRARFGVAVSHPEAKMMEIPTKLQSGLKMLTM